MKGPKKGLSKRAGRSTRKHGRRNFAFEFFRWIRRRLARLSSKHGSVVLQVKSPELWHVLSDSIRVRTDCPRIRFVVVRTAGLCKKKTDNNRCDTGGDSLWSQHVCTYTRSHVRAFPHTRARSTLSVAVTRFVGSVCREPLLRHRNAGPIYKSRR